MGYRRFEDDTGRLWEAWEVHPALVERRLNDDRRAAPRQTAERRKAAEVRFPIPRELEGGWLTFQCETEKRRLSPIPAHWMSLSDEDLVLLARTARPYRVTPPTGFRREP
ncbi:MAG TPA: hypothetical protein VN706_10240 [Gemmatimonadaceae bacterium]|nr:hypothetical protein [Gemmatimonadaceae bacterium]